MKNSNFLLLASLILSSTVISQDYDVQYSEDPQGNFDLVLDIESFDVGEVILNGITYSRIGFDKQVTTEQKGYAELPYLHASVMIGPLTSVSLEVVPGEFEDIQLDHPLVPSRGTIYRNQNPSAIPYVIDPRSVTDTFYPGNLASAGEPFILRDIRGVNVYFYPFQYNALTRTLRVYKDMNVRLVKNGSAPVNPLIAANEGILREMDAIYRNVFINYSTAGRDALTVGEVGDILVITTARDEGAIQPYVDWKTEKGYHVSVEVVPSLTVVNSVVQDAYDSNNDLLYVLLVGDWDDLRCNTTGFGSPMDPQVGCVAGDDDYADLAVGRFSANSPSDVNVQVDKVIHYEKFPEAGASWYSTATGVASAEGAGIGDDDEIDYGHNDVIWNDKLDPFTFEAYNAIYDPGASASDVTTALNAGTSLLNYTGHGSGTSWGTTGFSNSSIAGLANGDMLPWIVSVACNNGDFHTGTCFGEAWVRKAGGGAVMFLGASISQPWDPPMRGQDYFMDVLTGGYDYDAHPDQSGINTDEQRTTIGAIIFNGLTLMCVESGGSSDWETAKTWNTFGDPAMQVRTAAPADLDLSGNLVMAGVPFTTTITSSGEPVENAMVALSRDGQVFRGFTDASGMVSIDHALDPGSATLVVTGFNTETIYMETTVIPPDGPFVQYASMEVNDAEGNGNGQIDYHETVMMTIGITNIGTEEATEVEVYLSSDDMYITLADTMDFFGDILPGDTVYITDAFQMTVHDTVPDLHSINFSLSANGNTGMTWSSGFTALAHAPELQFAGFTVIDTLGNSDGRLDPGETAIISVLVVNAGSSAAYASQGFLATDSDFLTFVMDTAFYSDLQPGDSVERSFEVTADPATPPGQEVHFDFILAAMYSVACHGEFDLYIGQIPALVIDLDGNHNSAPAIKQCLDNWEVSSGMADAFPLSLNLYKSVFVCLGTYPDNHVLSIEEGQFLEVYLENGGNLYMEGADTWYYDQQTDPTPVHPMFMINGIADGTNDLTRAVGQGGSIAGGLIFDYSGDNSYIDHIEAIEPARMVFMNPVPEYGTAVSYEGEGYKTVGSSFELGGLDDGESTKDELMIRILDFFGIDGLWTSVTETAETPGEFSSAYPNPAKDRTNFVFNLEQASHVVLEIYSSGGHLVSRLLDSQLNQGIHQVEWDLNGGDASTVGSGIYYYRLFTGKEPVTGKIVVVR